MESRTNLITEVILAGLQRFASVPHLHLLVGLIQEGAGLPEEGVYRLDAVPTSIFNLVVRIAQIQFPNFSGERW
jgi:hypothetical protein